VTQAVGRKIHHPDPKRKISEMPAGSTCEMMSSYPHILLDVPASCSPLMYDELGRGRERERDKKNTYPCHPAFDDEMNRGLWGSDEKRVYWL
jgi:hypothetical protein